MVHQQPVGRDQGRANSDQNLARAQIQDLHIQGCCVQHIRLRAIGGVSHIKGARGHGVAGNGFPGADGVAGDQVVVFVGHQEFRAGIVQRHALGIYAGGHGRDLTMIGRRGRAYGGEAVGERRQAVAGKVAHAAAQRNGIGLVRQQHRVGHKVCRCALQLHFNATGYRRAAAVGDGEIAGI